MPDDFILAKEDISPQLRAWLEQVPAAQTLVVEQLDDGRVLLRPMPDVDPVLLAHLRVTIAQYHEALMNLT